MDKDDSKKSLLEEYIDLSKKSLIKVQYSCGGNSTDIEEQESIPIIPDSFVPESNIIYESANEEDVETIIELLKANKLPVNDLGLGQRIFLVARLDGKTIGCVAVELHGDAGLLRSLAVNTDFRGKGIGQKLVAEAEAWSLNNGLKNLYLLTTTAADFFPKIGWHNVERASVPESIASSSEFASVCPSTAACMHKTIN
jgi:N-acetylglutamate synthase-like GNAT family acetyltransferase